jgi:predicted permease
VTYGDSVPLSIYGMPYDRVQSFGTEADESGVISLPRTIVAPGYFQLMRIPLLEGRDFTYADDLTREPVIVVNQTFVRKYLDGRNPLGRRLLISGGWSTIVGLVADSKYRAPGEGPTPSFYGSFGQMFWSGHNDFFYIRARDLDAARLTVRREVAALDPNRGLYELSTLSDATQAGLFGERVAASLLSALAVLALVLAAIGLYSVMAYAVSERTQEIGVRMALGAGQGQVLSLILRRGVGMTLAGLAVGIAGALATTRVLGSAVESSFSADPAVFAFAALTLLAVALLASYIPARRATRVDPMTTLRSE